MSFLKHLVYRDESFEHLDFILQDRLSIRVTLLAHWPHGAMREASSRFHAAPEGLRRLVVPCINDAAPDMFSLLEVSFGNETGCRLVMYS